MSSSLSAETKNKSTRQFKGLDLEERQRIRREKLIEAGLQTYGTQGFFSVTIKDICKEAKLTERYFYESFKRSEELFTAVYLQLVNELQKNVVNAVHKALPDREKMIEAGLSMILRTLHDDPRIARILFIDAVLVHELHGQTINESMSLFDRTIVGFIQLIFPDKELSSAQTVLVATGLNGYVVQIAMRWVMGGFKYPMDQVLDACKVGYMGILKHLELNP